MSKNPNPYTRSHAARLHALEALETATEPTELERRCAEAEALFRSMLPAEAIPDDADAGLLYAMLRAVLSGADMDDALAKARQERARYRQWQLDQERRQQARRQAGRRRERTRTEDE